MHACTEYILIMMSPEADHYNGYHEHSRMQAWADIIIWAKMELPCRCCVPFTCMEWKRGLGGCQSCYKLGKHGCSSAWPRTTYNFIIPCLGKGNYGNIILLCWLASHQHIICTQLIFAIISAVVFALLSFVCCIPMLWLLLMCTIFNHAELPAVHAQIAT